MRYMNFVYNSIEKGHTIVIGRIKYVWDGVDIRDFISEEVAKQAEDIVLVKNGGVARVKQYSKIPAKRKYQIIDSKVEDNQIKSKFLLISPDKVKWDLSEIMSEGIYDKGDKYIEIGGEDISDLDVLSLASNLSYMYGIRFIPHVFKQGSFYRITSEFDFPEVWKHIDDNVNEIKKFYKLSEVYLDSARGASKPNETKLVESDFTW